MGKYYIYYNNNVNVNKVAEFDTLDEAKQYCTKNTKGYDKVCDNDNCYKDCSNNFHYEVYDGVKVIFDEYGDVAYIKDPVYETEQFYCD